MAIIWFLGKKNVTGRIRESLEASLLAAIGGMGGEGSGTTFSAFGGHYFGKQHREKACPRRLEKEKARMAGLESVLANGPEDRQGHFGSRTRRVLLTRRS